MKKVVIDTDYFRVITQDYTNDELFLKVMQELEFEPVMHEFVYKQEMHENSFIKRLVDEQYITIYDYDLLTREQTDAIEYRRLFRLAYYELNGTHFSDDHSIKNYHHEKENLGEIHSTILAKLMNYDVLMSNDGGARTFIEKRINTGKNHISVYNIVDTFMKLISVETSSIKWPDIKNVMKQLRKNGNKTDEEKYQTIQKRWVGEKK